MPEETWAAHGGIPACDSCHSRKVKCDRRDPCGTCAASGMECVRKREKKRPAPRIRADEQIRNLVEKLSNLEKVVSHKVLPPETAVQGSTTQSPSTDIDTSSRPIKRRRDARNITTQDLLSPPDSVASQQRPNECCNFIQKELSYNSKLAECQRSILEIAVSFIEQLSQAPSSAPADHAWGLQVSTDFTPGELIQIVLANQRGQSESSRLQLHTLDHIPPKALEKMAVGLLEGTADTQTLNMYKAIVHFKAALNLYASQLESPQNPAVREHIKQMQLHHLSAAFIALNSISVLAPPCLLLLQTQLTGAILMHIIGNSMSCWSLTAYASRTLVALGYHTLSGTVPETEEQEEINAAVAWCYHFDRLMSLLLLRPPSLPNLNITVSSLVKHDPANPMSIFATVMLEMVPIYEKILQLTLESPSSAPREPRSSIQSEVADLLRRLEDISTMMEKANPTNRQDSNADYLLHWQCLEFRYCSTLTAVYRLSPTVTSDPRERERCLHSARKALSYVKQIQHLGKQRGHFLEEYSPYLSWTILSYPLCPFFVLFCNVVGTSSQPDFQLLQDVVDSVESLVVENKYIARLHRLCTTLLALCKPLVDGALTEDAGPRMPDATLAPSTSAQRQPHGTALGVEVGGLAEMEQVVGDMPRASWDHEMMWQLFQAQPSLDWFNADILDPASYALDPTS